MSVRGQRGYTLVELTAVLALLLLLLGTAVLRFGALQPRGQVRAAAQRLAGDLRLAAQRAVLEGVAWELVLDGPGGYHLYYWAPDRHPAPGWSPYLFHGTGAVTLPGGVVISGITPPGGAVTPGGGGPADGVQFAATAGSPGAGTVITLSDGAGDRYQVRVHAVSGLVEVCNGTCP